ncbi:MAG: thioredoxin [Candidatus Goldbacteria bacterium]|nr:thioredoxin [Candidatus Goldiibacteriota bacterium]
MEKLIDVETERQLKQKFMQEMKKPVDVILFTNLIILPGKEDTQEINNFARQILKELSAIEPRILIKELPLSDKVAIDLGIKTSPSIAIGYDFGYRIVFNGAPLGHEATSLIELITLVSAGESHLDDNIKILLKNISDNVHLQIFTTPTCPYCPIAVIQAGQLAIELKGKIKAECVESAENQELAAKYNVSSVPHTVINGISESSIIGVVSEKKFVEHILKFAGNEEIKIKLQQEEKIKKEKEKLIDNPQEVIYITENNFEEAINKYENIVIDFWAEWCAPCKMLSPIIEQLAKENFSKIVFGKLNVDENPNIAAEYEIMSIPTLLIFNKGKKVGQLTGAQSKSELEKQIKDILEVE